jgi:hypothetical protein
LVPPPAQRGRHGPINRHHALITSARTRPRRPSGKCGLTPLRRTRRAGWTVAAQRPGPKPARGGPGCGGQRQARPRGVRGAGPPNCSHRRCRSSGDLPRLRAGPRCTSSAPWTCTPQPWAPGRDSLLRPRYGRVVGCNRQGLRPGQHDRAVGHELLVDTSLVGSMNLRTCARSTTVASRSAAHTTRARSCTGPRR